MTKQPHQQPTTVSLPATVADHQRRLQDRSGQGRDFDRRIDEATKNLRALKTGREELIGEVLRCCADLDGGAHG